MTSPTPQEKCQKCGKADKQMVARPLLGGPTILCVDCALAEHSTPQENGWERERVILRAFGNYHIIMGEGGRCDCGPKRTCGEKLEDLIFSLLSRTHKEAYEAGRREERERIRGLVKTIDVSGGGSGRRLKIQLLQSLSPDKTQEDKPQ